MNAVLPARIEAYGLRISSVDDPDADVLWQRERVAVAADSGSLPASIECCADGIWIHQVFTNPLSGIAAVRFSTSADGSRVVSRFLACVDETHLLDVLMEPVMRTILVQRGLISFHAAALVKNGQAIMLMGQKGAGKSTLCAALLEQGWSILADDLVRLAESGAGWHAFPGRRHVKLNGDSAEALDRCGGSLRKRWMEEIPESAGNKYILDAARAAPLLEEYPLRAIFMLQKRDASRTGLSIETTNTAEKVRQLLANATPHAVNVHAPPTQEYSRAVTGLMSQCAIHSVRLPDRLQYLRDAARAVDGFIATGCASTAVDPH